MNGNGSLLNIARLRHTLNPLVAVRKIKAGDHVANYNFHVLPPRFYRVTPSRLTPRRNSDRYKITDESDARNTDKATDRCLGWIFFGQKLRVIVGMGIEKFNECELVQNR